MSSEQKEYCIDIELQDGSKLISWDQRNDFVTKYIAGQQLSKVQEDVSGLICFTHHNFPIVELAENMGLLVIRVRCCCQEFFNIVDKRFHGKQK